MNEPNEPTADQPQSVPAEPAINQPQSGEPKVDRRQFFGLGLKTYVAPVVATLGVPALLPDESEEAYGQMMGMGMMMMMMMHMHMMMHMMMMRKMGMGMMMG
jgi:hypothetical protein